jgi:ankyrin repeat protein
MSVFELLSAASVGDLQLLQQLLDGGLSPEAATPAGWTALHAAAMAGQLESMQLLLQRGASVEAATLQGGYVPLHAAARAGQTDAMQLLLGAKAKVDAADHMGYVPTCHAALTGDADAVFLLLDAGADAAWWALYLAAEAGHYQMVRLLISRGADVHGRTACELQLTALHAAARMGHAQAVQELLAAGADVNAVPGPLSNTALYAAEPAGQDDDVQLPLADGAQVNPTISLNGMSPLLMAASLGHGKVVKLLLAAGADLHHALPNNCRTALHLAAAGGHVEVTELLISAGANVETEATYDACNYRPLQVAATQGYAAVARKLLAAGADVLGGADCYLYTPLRLAAVKGNLEVVQVVVESLLGSGADIMEDMMVSTFHAGIRGHMTVWAFLTRTVVGINPQALYRCVLRGGEAATKALVTGWEHEIGRHEEVLKAAEVEIAKGEAARKHAQELIIKCALMECIRPDMELVEPERTMVDREEADLVQLQHSRSDMGMGSCLIWQGFCLASMVSCVAGSTYLWWKIPSRFKWQLKWEFHSKKGS